MTARCTVKKRSTDREAFASVTVLLIVPHHPTSYVSVASRSLRRGKDEHVRLQPHTTSFPSTLSLSFTVKHHGIHIEESWYRVHHMPSMEYL